MQLFSVLGALLPILSLVQTRQFPLSNVDAVFDRFRHGYSKYLYHSPSPGSTSSVKKHDVVSPAAAGQAYWYEGIAHQGISAFGAAGYKVYRNVKDFGAKGNSSGPASSMHLTVLQVMVLQMTQPLSMLPCKAVVLAVKIVPQAQPSLWLSISLQVHTWSHRLYIQHITP